MRRACQFLFRKNMDYSIWCIVFSNEIVVMCRKGKKKVIIPPEKHKRIVEDKIDDIDRYDPLGPSPNMSYLCKAIQTLVSLEYHE